jgi:small subunit ribosomal protein S15
MKKIKVKEVEEREKKREKKLKREEIEKIIVDLAKKGYSSAQIGLILKDKYNILKPKKYLKEKISKIMQKHGIYPEIPEDLLFLLKKAVNLHEHLQRHKKDKHSKRGLELLESKIRCLAKYYIRKGKLPKNWKYSYEEARLLVQK